MFQFGRFAHYVQLVFNQLGFPIQKSTDQFIFADPRGLSQLITSFIASESQGIPRILFLTFFYSCAFCAAWYAFLIICQLYGPKTASWQRLYCCLLFFFNFFQYVKELFNPGNISSYYKHAFCNRHRWLWRITESNRWPPACKAGALASWANPPFIYWYHYL